MAEKIIHQGRNVKRFRELMGLKQEGLASMMGHDWNQQKISLLEQRELIDPSILDEVAKALKVPVESIKNFSEEAIIYNIQNNYDGANSGSGTIANTQSYQYCTFNPYDKLVEVLEENKKLYAALLKEKDEQIVLLKALLPSKKDK